MAEPIPPLTPAPGVPTRKETPPVASATADGAGAYPASTRVQVVRSAHAAVYVYRLLDSASGRPLLQLPFPVEEDRSRPGVALDTLA